MPTFEQARLWYSKSDPIHNYDHILRVYRLAEQIAQQEGADLEIVRAAVLLHDVDKASLSGITEQETENLKINNQRSQTHHLSSAEFARQVLIDEGWAPKRIAAVEHCIRSHRFRDRSEQPATLEAQVLFDADKLDAIGAIGVARAIAFAVLANQPFYAAPSKRFLQSGEKEIGESHSAYHEYIYKLAKLKELLFTATARKLAEERHSFMVSFFERLRAELEK